MKKHPELEAFGEQQTLSLKADIGDWQPATHSVTLGDPSSKYKVSSALQKCIRRGMADKAEFYAHAMYNGKEHDYLWRRLPVVLLEDVGPTNMKLCAQALNFFRFKSVRESVGELRGLSWLVRAMANSVKTRVLCDMVCTVEYAHDHLDSMISGVGQDMMALGWVPEPGHWTSQMKFHPWATDDELLEVLTTQYGQLSAYVLYAADKKSVDGLHGALRTALSLLGPWTEKATDLQPPVYLHGVPDWAFDKHTLDGKRGLSYVLKASKSLKSLGFEPTIEQLRMTMFHAETALLDRKAWNPELERIEQQVERVESQHVGLSHEQHQQFKQLLESNEFKAEMLYARQRVLGLV